MVRNMIKIIEKLIGAIRANLIFICKINSVKREGFKHYVGRLGKRSGGTWGRERI